MDSAIRAAWKPINRRYESAPEPSVDKFMNAYRQHVKRSEMNARVPRGGASSAVRAQCNYLGVWPY